MSWLSTFSRFKPGRTPIAGSIGLLVSDWSHPQRGEAPMFDSPLLERLSVVHPLGPTLIYLPVGLWLAFDAARGATGWMMSVLLYGAGLLLWSAVEYLAHRGSFHREPQSQNQVAFAYLVHGVHHAFPDDSRRWMMPVGVTIPIALVIFGLSRTLLGAFADPALAGFFHGYLTYDLLHYFIHRGRMPGRIGRFLRRHHLAHHYTRPDKYFGVSSPLWDIVFRTR